MNMQITQMEIARITLKVDTIEEITQALECTRECAAVMVEVAGPAFDECYIAGDNAITTAQAVIGACFACN